MRGMGMLVLLRDAVIAIASVLLLLLVVVVADCSGMR
jgi:hypothetical protein